MALYTAAQLTAKITAVDTAIETVLLGQQYTINTGQGSQTVTRADLKSLRALKAEYELRLSRLSSGGYPTSGEIIR